MENIYGWFEECVMPWRNILQVIMLIEGLSGCIRMRRCVLTFTQARLQQMLLYQRMIMQVKQV
jgi:hypothetical protein